MKTHCSLLVALMILVGFGTAWDCDRRCGEDAYERCREGNRELESTSVEHHNADPRATNVEAAADTTVDKNERNHLRLKATTTRSMSGDIHEHRHLAERRFKLKMYHEESRDYCWQGEWEDPEWCMECQGRSCDEGENLEIGRCNTGYDDDQFFVYESIPDKQGGRIKPYKNQRLCLMRTSDRQHTLEVCDDDDEIADEQIILGFDWDEDMFKLRPYSRADHCLTQHHHPKDEEVVYAAECQVACDDNTCYWEIIDERESDPSVEFIGFDVCSESDPCDHCYGDCNSDDECLDDLECYKRDYGEETDVPSCRGGEEYDNGQDFCVPPEYNRRRAL